MSRKARGYVTDGEKALSDALAETMPKATGLRCFNHFRENCKSKLKSVGITKKQEQAFFIEWVFGTHPNSVLEAEDKKDLKLKLTVLKDELKKRREANNWQRTTFLDISVSKREDDERFYDRKVKKKGRHAL